MSHVVRTPHIQRLIREALALAEECDMRDANNMLFYRGDKEFTAFMALERASNLLRHAAEELEDERQALLGWGQV